MPQFKPKEIVGAIIAKKKGAPVEEMEEEMPMEGEEDMMDDMDGERQCAMELIDAVKAGDPDAVIGALRSAFAIFDSEPHEEGEHLDEDMGDDMMSEEDAI
jgi:hypothetical protein